MSDDVLEITGVPYIHRPKILSWNIIKDCVLDNLEAKYGRKFTEHDKEAIEMLEHMSKFWKAWWDIDEGEVDVANSDT